MMKTYQEIVDISNKIIDTVLHYKSTIDISVQDEVKLDDNYVRKIQFINFSTINIVNAAKRSSCILFVPNEMKYNIFPPFGLNLKNIVLREVQSILSEEEFFQQSLIMESHELAFCTFLNVAISRSIDFSFLVQGEVYWELLYDYKEYMS